MRFLKELYFFLIRNYMRFKYPNIKLNNGVKTYIGTVFEGNNKIGFNTSFEGFLGRCSYIGNNSIIKAHIGKYTSISDNVVTINKRHPVNSFISTSPVFYSLKKQSNVTYVSQQKFLELDNFENKNYSIIIGNDVLISYGVTIIGKISIGDGAILAANCTVTKDVPPYSVVAGIPAKIIRYRFSQEVIDKLIKFSWWNKPEQWIRDNADKFSNVNEFIQLIGKKE